MSSVAELEPGDLIFYSGTLLEADAKRHPFDMTHVEIYMGGAATLGEARQLQGQSNRGLVVQSAIFPLIAAPT